MHYFDTGRKGYISLSDWKSAFGKICSGDSGKIADFLFKVIDVSGNLALSAKELVGFFEGFIKLYFLVAEAVFILERKAMPEGVVNTAKVDKRVINAKKRCVAAHETATAELVALVSVVDNFEDPLHEATWLESMKDGANLPEVCALLVNIMGGLVANVELTPFSIDDLSAAEMESDAGLPQLQLLRSHSDLKARVCPPVTHACMHPTPCTLHHTSHPLASD